MTAAKLTCINVGKRETALMHGMDFIVFVVGSDDLHRIPISKLY